MNGWEHRQFDASLEVAMSWTQVPGMVKENDMTKTRNHTMEERCD